MKKTLITLLAMCGMAVAADEQYIVLTFSGERTPAHTTDNQATGMFGSETSGYYNNVTTDANKGYTSGNLIYTDGGVSAFTATLNKPLSGDAGQILTIEGDTSAITSIFGAATMERVVNDNGGSSITFNNLIAGSYTFYVLGARGNNYGTANELTTYSITGATSVEASIISYNVGDGITLPTVSAAGDSVIAYTHSVGNNQTATNWTLMQFKFDVENYGSQVTLQALGNTGNIAAVAMIIPEPATATLSLLALAGLAARRRRK